MHEWTGFRDKTVWDWFSILVVPILIAIAAGSFSLISLRSEENRAQAQLDIEQRRAESDRWIASDRAREDALQTYLDRMTELLLGESLGGVDQGDQIHQVARARTITILQSLDGARNRSVLRFLHDTDLILKREEFRGNALISLIDADLSNTDLQGVILLNANLHGANLSNANLQRTTLQDTNLQGIGLSNAVLQDANLKGALLRDADLCSTFLLNANLSGADLSEAILINTMLNGADLSGANLQGADFGNEPADGAARCSKLHRATSLGGASLTNADLRGANLRGAKVSNEQLAQAKDLVGATMPDGKEMTAELWVEFKNSLSVD